MKNHHFKNDNFYDENQKYYIKLNDFFAPMIEESVKFFGDFNVEKNHDKRFFAQFLCFST